MHIIQYDEIKFQQELIRTKNSEDVKNYLLTTSELGKLVQEKIDLLVIDGRLNGAHIRNQYPLYKNFIRSPNSLEKIFRDRSKFDWQNTILGDLLQQVNKRTIEDMLKDALNLDMRMSDADIQRSLDKLRGKSTPPLPGNDNFNLTSSPGSDTDIDKLLWFTTTVTSAFSTTRKIYCTHS